MKTIYRFALSVALVLVPLIAQAEEIRDYYAEPGLQPFKASVGQDDTESIDPFGGTLQLHYTDISLPGNGGLDIEIGRSYTSSQGTLDNGGIMGLGWTMHFGRIVVPQAHQDKVCTQSLWSVTTADNPSLELPSGGRELLVLNSIHNDGSLITKSNWKVECTSNGFVAYSPDGKRYYINKVEFVNNVRSWYTTKIVDKYGNSIDIEYRSLAGGYQAINRISASDGRVVNFEYDGSYLSKIIINPGSSDSATWTYVYTPLDSGECFDCHHAHLREVIRPDGLKWQYEYYPLTTNDTAGSYSVKTVTYPYGGVTTYTYQYVWFDNNTESTRTTAIASKVNSGRSVTPGTWTYEFFPGSVYVSQAGRYLDRTLVTAPNNKQEFLHYGYIYTSNWIDILWAVGLLREQSIYSLSGELLQKQIYGWDKRKISNENYWHGRSDTRDNGTYAPVQLSVLHSEDGEYNQTIRYENYDAYGNPRRIRATPYLSTDPEYVVNQAFTNDTANWRIGLLRSQETVGLGVIDYTLNALGDVEEENRYGVTTSYTYHADGNIASITDANDNTISYEDYYRGIAQTESQPEEVTITRNVNDGGTLRSLTNGRGYQRSYTWTPTNELESITYPINASVHVEYDATSKTLQRGSYIETTEFDGFGRVTRITRTDSGTGQSVFVTSEYDAVGQKVFQSYPNATIGTTFEYDGLGRTTKTIHPDGSYSTIAYPHPVREVWTDERNNQTTYLYRAFGNPNNQRTLMEVHTEENRTLLSRNLLGQLTRVHQGEYDPEDSMVYGYTRDLTYTSTYFLETETHPEIGTIHYEHDAVGNVTSKRINDEIPTVFVYDDLNRLIFVDYPDSTPDVTTTYNENGQVVTLVNAHSAITYDYDENDNLYQETHSIDGHDYIIHYDINELDHVDAMTYPSGRVVPFNVDVYGRVQQALPYVTLVDYHPGSQINNIQFANGQTTSYQLNDRQFIRNISTTGISAALDLTYDYFPDGNVERITNALTPTSDFRVKEMGYDAIGRLTQVQYPLSGNIQEFEYDAYDNIRAKRKNGEVTSAYSYNGMTLGRVTTADARLRWVNYDTHGNVTFLSTTDAFGSELFDETEMVYDRANNLVFAQRRAESDHGGLQTVGAYNYAYDGHNKRIKEVNLSSGKPTHFIYSSSGQLIGEYPEDPFFGKEYIYIGAQLVAAVQENRLPVADGGSDQQAIADQTVTLDGSNSSDPDGQIVSYQWSQVSGPSVSLQNANQAEAQFVAPTVSEATDLVFQLTVTDNDGAQHSIYVTVSVEASEPPPPNTPPMANAGPDQTTLAGDQAFLDGSASSVSEGSIAYSWQQVSGPIVELHSVNSATPYFWPEEHDQDYELRFRLTVTDENELSASDEVTVVVLSRTLHDPEPVTVTNLRVLAGDKQNLVVWEPVDSAAGYRVYWGSAPGFTLENAQYVDLIESQWLHKNLLNGHAQYYVVAAYNDTGESVPSAEVSATPNTREWHPSQELTIPSGYDVLDVQMSERGDKYFLLHDTNSTRHRLAVQRNDDAPVVISSPSSGAIRPPSMKVSDTGDVAVIWQRYWPNYSTGYWQYDYNVAQMDRNLTNITTRTAGANVNWTASGFNSRGDIVLAWTHSSVGHIWAEAYSTGAGWGGAYQVSTLSSTGLDITLSEDAQALITWRQNANSETSSPAGIYKAALADLETGQWSDPELLFTDTHASDVSHVIDDDGTVHVVQRISTTTRRGTSYSLLLEQSDVATGSILGSQHPELSLSGSSVSTPWNAHSNGSVVAGWYESLSTNQGSTRILVLKRYLGNGTWAPRIEYEYSPLSLHLGPRFIHASGDALFIGSKSTSEADGTFYTRAAFIEQSNGGWSPIITLDDAPDIGTSSTYRIRESRDVYGNAFILWRCACESGTRIFLKEYKPGDAPPSQPPIANAGADQSVNAGNMVTLDGSASTDPDGVIEAYSWSQTDGPAVALANADSVIASFTAPAVTEPTTLTFELMVTDDSGATDQDSVNVVVSPAPPDTTAPVTTMTATESRARGITSYAVTFSADKPVTTTFRVTGQGTVTAGGADTTDWQTYTSQITIQLDKHGTATIEYYSIDSAGNQEETKSGVLQ
jgi:YD repeat-containing protein